MKSRLQAVLHRLFGDSKGLYGLYAILATLFGLAVGQLAASLLNPASSPFLAIGSQIIDLTPHQLKDAAIAQFGSNDKTILLSSIFVGVLVLASLAGLLARRSLRAGLVMLFVLVAIAGFAAMNRPTVEAVDIVPSLLTLIAGLSSMVWLDRAHRTGRFSFALPVPGRHADAAPDAVARAKNGVETPSDAKQAARESTGATAGPPTRRSVLIMGGVLAVAAAVMGSAGKLISSIRSRPEDINLPAAADPAEALPTGIEGKYPGITPFRTSNADFYRVDTRLDTPVLDADSWTLTIDGMVDKELEFTFDDLLAMPLIERNITLTCVSNSVGGPYIGGATWLGVRLKDLLDMAGVSPDADQIFSTDYDGMTISTPIDLALDGRDAMIAVGMNGQPLPREHGFPARMIVPGLYGFISATKWITKITLTTYADQSAYWTDRKWATDAPIKISSRIDVPQALSTVQAGDTFIGGVAWAQGNGGVAKVQVSIDGGAWDDAKLGPSGGNVYWRQWYYPWTAKKGSSTLACRVIDGDGNTQSAARANPFPDGSSGIQQLVVNVT